MAGDNEAAAERMVELLNDAGWEPRTDYSGRGMYGERCVAVHVDDAAQLAALGARLVVSALATADDKEQVAEDVASMLDGTAVDGMGRGLVAYWPALRTGGRP